MLFLATPYLSYFKQKKTKTISKVADCIILDETYIKVPRISMHIDLKLNNDSVSQESQQLSCKALNN